MTKLDSPVRQALGEILDLAPGVPDTPHGLAAPPLRRSRVLIAAAAAVVALGLFGVAVVATSGERSEVVRSQPSTSVAATPIPADGRLTLDPVPVGLAAGVAQRAFYPVADELVIYATDERRPETGPVLLVQTAANDELHGVPEQAERVSVQGASGFAWTDMDGEKLAFGPVDGSVHVLIGTSMSGEQVLTAAEGAAVTADGPAIDEAALPIGMSVLSIGSYNESNAFTPSAGSQNVETVGAYWNSADFSRHVSYRVAAEFGAMFAANRVGHDSVTDVDVHGNPGYLVVDEFPDAPASLTVVWTDGARNVFLTGLGYTEAELLAIAETMRPATAAEWSAMLLAADESVGGTVNEPPVGPVAAPTSTAGQ